MRQKTEEELKQNYTRFIGIINKYFTGERLEKLLHMYSESELGINLTLAPASGNVNYHNAYIGGYIDHIFNVTKNSLRMKETFAAAGGEIDFTDEELVFTALHHDLGKLGTKDNLHYIQNDSDWHIKNRGDAFKMNTDNSYMTLTDRTFFTLNHYGITYNEKEYFGIKLTDGMFDEENIKYYKTHDITKSLRYNIQYVMHWADYMSTIIERQNFRNSQK
jgi:hypothetical protein